MPAWNEQVALVTGASSGIGRATALAFASEGARVVASDLLGNEGEETVRMIEGRGGEAVFVRTDVSSPAEVAKLVGRAVDAYRRLDLAFNDAGVEDAMAMTAECSEDNRDRTLNINLKGVYLCMKHELPRMLERKRGIGGLTRVAAVMWLCSGSASFVTGQALAVDGGWVAQ